MATEVTSESAMPTDLVQRVRDLSRQEKYLLIEMLLDEVDSSEEISSSWRTEIERRSDSLHEGTAVTRTVEEVNRLARAEIDAIRAGKAS